MTTNFELEEIVKKLTFKTKFLGCYMKDQIPPKQKNCWFIANLNPSTKNDRGHWVLCWNGSESVYYSSVGDPPPPEFIKWYDGYILTSNFQIQQFDTSICGEISILIAFFLDHGCDFKDIILELPQ